MEASSGKCCVTEEGKKHITHLFSPVFYSSIILVVHITTEYSQLDSIFHCERYCLTVYYLIEVRLKHSLPLCLQAEEKHTDDCNKGVKDRRLGNEMLITGVSPPPHFKNIKYRCAKRGNCVQFLSQPCHPSTSLVPMSTFLKSFR